MAELSIIIVSYNTKDLLKDCLTSIYKAIQPSKGLEVFVVDNNSHDGSQQMVKQDFPQVKLIANKTNKGFAAANNQAAKKATGKYLLFLNSDTKVSKYSLVKPLKYLRNHPKVGGLTVKLILGNGKIDPDNHRGFPTPWTSITYFTGLAKLFKNSRLFNSYHQSYKDFSKIHKIEVAAGSYIMMPAKLFNQLKGWDETYFFYGEDIDLCYRINQAGFSIVYYPKVTVIHYKGASSGLRKETQKIAKPPKETRIKVAHASVKAMEIFYQKFYKHKYPALITSLILSGIKLRGFFRILKHQLS